MSFDRLGKVRFEKRVDALNNIGNTTVSKIIQSKRDKERDAKRQRKEKKWRFDF